MVINTTEYKRYYYTFDNSHLFENTQNTTQNPSRIITSGFFRVSTGALA